MKVGKWDPGELVNKIKEKHNIDKLIEDKVILKNPEHHFEMIKGESRIKLPKQDDYLS